MEMISQRAIRHYGWSATAVSVALMVLPSCGGTSSAVPAKTAARRPPSVSSNERPASPSTLFRPARVGTYRYRQSGGYEGFSKEQSPTIGRVVVRSPAHDGTVTYDREIAPDLITTSVLEFGDQGIAIRSIIQHSGPVKITCTFDPPLRPLPWPIQLGASSSAVSDCGGTTTQFTTAVTRTASVLIDGHNYDAYVVDSKTVAQGDITGNQTSSDWYAPALGLIVHTHFTSSGTYGAVPFSAELTSDLLDAAPHH